MISLTSPLSFSQACNIKVLSPRKSIGLIGASFLWPLFIADKFGISDSLSSSGELGSPVCSIQF